MNFNCKKWNSYHTVSLIEYLSRLKFVVSISNGDRAVTPSTCRYYGGKADQGRYTIAITSTLLISTSELALTIRELNP